MGEELLREVTAKCEEAFEKLMERIGNEKHVVAVVPVTVISGTVVIQPRVAS